MRQWLKKHPRSNEFAVVIALAVLIAIVGWRAMVLVSTDGQSETPGTFRVAATSGEFLVYGTYNVVDRGTEPWPNDDKLAYVFYRYPLAGGQPEVIAKVIEDNTKAFGSPWMRPLSENTLLFMRRDASADDFVWIDAAGRELERPVPPTGSGIDGLPSPDGSRVAYVDPGTKTVTVVTRGALLQTFEAKSGSEAGFWAPLAWTPDGGKLYLRPVFDGGGFVSGLWVIDLDKPESAEIEPVGRLGLKDISVNAGLGLLVGSTYRSGALEAEPTGPSKIYLVDLNAGEEKFLLTEDSLAFRDPLLSPDGRRLVYSFGGSDPDIWLNDIGSPDSRLLISGRALAWTPDGRFLVVSRDNELQLVEVDGNQIVSVAHRTGKYQDPDFRGLEFIGIVKSKNP